MKFVRNNWLDLSTRTPLYGIDAFAEGEWMHCCEGDPPKLLLFSNEEDRDQKLKELRLSQSRKGR